MTLGELVAARTAAEERPSNPTPRSAPSRQQLARSWQARLERPRQVRPHFESLVITTARRYTARVVELQGGCRMKAIATAYKAIKRRRDVVARRLAQAQAKTAPLELELKEIDSALHVFEPLIEPMGRKGTPAAAERDEKKIHAERQWKSGISPTRIARELEIAVPTLYSWAKAGGWGKQPRGGK